MQNYWKEINTKNIGLFKTKFINKEQTPIDSGSLLKVYSELESMTDTLFLSLSRGIRYPSIWAATLSYNTSKGEWALDPTKRNTQNFIEGITTTLNGTKVDYIDVTFNYAETLGKTDFTPLIFANFTSGLDSTSYSYNQVPFVRVEDLIHNTSDFTCRLKLEASKPTEFEEVDFGGARGYEGYSLNFQALFQTVTDNTDRDFVTRGTPYFYDSIIYVGPDSVRLTSYVYSDAVAGDRTFLDTPAKTRIRAQAWTGDCDLGTGYGPYYYSDWEFSFTSPQHSSRIESLNPSTKYKVWGQIITQSGADLLDWSAIGCVTTKDEYGGRDEWPGFEEDQE